MKKNRRPYARSKIFAWYIAIATTALSIYSIHKGMPEVVMAIYVAGMASAAAQYANSTYNGRKYAEIDSDNKKYELENKQDGSK
jgi:L-lactate permease